MLTFHRVSRKKLWIKPSAQGLNPLQIDHCVLKYKTQFNTNTAVLQLIFRISVLKDGIS